MARAARANARTSEKTQPEAAGEAGDQLAWGPRLIRRPIARVAFFLAAPLLLAFGVWLQGADYCRAQAATEAEVLNYVTADRWLQRAEWFDADDPEIALERSRIARRRGQVTRTADLITEAIKRGADPATLERETWLVMAEEGNYEPLAKRLSELLIAGDDLPLVFEAWIRGMLQGYQLDKASEMIDVWKDNFPDAPRPHIYEARIAEHNGEFDRSEQALRSAIQRREDHAWAWYELGQLLDTRLRYDESLAAFERAGELLEEPEPALVGQAGALRQLDRLDEARERLAAALARPEDRLAEVYRQLGDDADDARAEAFAEAGRIEMAAEKPTEAVGYFEQALELKPYNRRARYSYAEALRQLGRRDEAAEQSKRVAAVTQALAACDKLVADLKTEPNNVEARVAVGKMLLEYIDPDQGVYWLGTALELDPANIEAHRTLRDHYVSVGKPQRARPHERFVPKDDAGEDPGEDDESATD